jgi:hypothetical protein
MIQQARVTEFLSGSQKCCGVREFTMLVRLQHVSESLQQNRERVYKTVLHRSYKLSEQQVHVPAGDLNSKFNEWL